MLIGGHPIKVQTDNYTFTATIEDISIFWLENTLWEIRVTSKPKEEVKKEINPGAPLTITPLNGDKGEEYYATQGAGNVINIQVIPKP